MLLECLNEYFFIFYAYLFRDEKKVICNKFEQKSSSSALIWPEENRLIIGCLDGRVRNGSTYSNKCSTLYKTDSMVVALTQQ